jgi:hypothetical protein
MTLAELGAYVCSHLRNKGLEVVLSGGACVSVYTTNRYQSFDLDFIEPFRSTPLKVFGETLAELGFYRENRYFKHPDSEYWIEFPPGPISIGDEPVREVVDLELSTGSLRLISATDCVKDRLAGYYHWNDLQSLEQARMVARSNAIDLEEVRRWSEKEGKAKAFQEIEHLLRTDRECH